MKKDHVYANGDETYVKTTMLYADSSDKLFYDSAAKTDKVEKADLVELFTKGVTVVKAGVYYCPVCLNDTGLIATNGTAATTFTEA